MWMKRKREREQRERSGLKEIPGRGRHVSSTFSLPPNSSQFNLFDSPFLSLGSLSIPLFQHQSPLPSRAAVARLREDTNQGPVVPDDGRRRWRRRRTRRRPRSDVSHAGNNGRDDKNGAEGRSGNA